MDETTLDDLLECSVCLERLDTTSKVLPCQHTFCRKCLEVIVSSHNELRCPECRILIDIKIEELPPNVLLMRILGGLKNTTHNQINSSAKTLTPTPTIITKTSTNNANLNDHQNKQQPQQINNNSVKYITASVNRLGLDEQNHLLRQQFSSKLTPNLTIAPHVKALYDFTSKEVGDLNFKKGDKIYLRKRIDLNWFIGELNGREGAFPINHVKVIVPLPVPQCKALYDFRMGPMEEDGCLTFKKGAIINVFRRVDHNWAEGRIGDCIGIFPIAFVEMNPLAKQIINTPTNFSMQFSLSTRKVPSLPLESNSSSDTSSNITTSPNSSVTTSNTSSTSSTAPSSPTVATNTNQVIMEEAVKPRDNKEKRHSLTTLITNTNSNLMQTNRHSAEILNNSDPELRTQSTATKSENRNKTTQRQNNNINATTSSSSSSSIQFHQQNSKSNHSTNKLVANNNNNNNNTSPSSHSPISYVAIYAYKRQKSDELDLKKGSIYYVTEKCQDGWYKGTNRANKCGVFPGNYVALIKNYRNENNNQLQHTNNLSNKKSTSGSTVSQHKNSAFISLQSTSLQPPELPPRSNTINNNLSSLFTKPIGEHLDALFYRKQMQTSTNQPTHYRYHNECINTMAVPTSSTSQHQTNESCTIKDKDKKESTSSSAVSLMKRIATNMKRSKSPTLNLSPQSFSMDNPVFEDSFTDMCPTSATAVISTTTTTTTTTATASTSAATKTTTTTTTAAAGLSSTKQRNAKLSTHPVHVRSGSCPSQLLQTHPVDVNNSIFIPDPSSCKYTLGSQRLKGYKDRPTCIGIRDNADGNHSIRIINDNINSLNTTTATFTFTASQTNVTANKNSHTTLSSYHRKSQSLDAATISSQINNYNVTKNKSSSNTINERFRCIVSYPPNSEFELELNVGDIVYVHKKRDNGWYKGTHGRTGKTGLFPASFVEPDI